MLGAQYETDWLASTPVFYNERTRSVSRCINDVIDPTNWEWDSEGVRNYLEFGYSVFGQTPVKHVRFMLPCQRLTVTKDGLQIEELEDPALELLEDDKQCDERDVLEAIQSAVQGWESRQTGDIVIPTSGGFDSRLLNVMIKDKSRVRAFSFGLSSPQGSSYEVVRARRLSEILRTRWQQIELGGFLDQLEKWYDLYGVSTHAHGMYQMAFYKQVAEVATGATALLSGIIGDAWAGIRLPKIQDPSDLMQLGYSHGMCADQRRCKTKADDETNRRAFYRRYEPLIASPTGAVVVAMRLKMILLSYLFRVPRAFGFQPWSPFLDPQIALAMLCISPERRRNRAWQEEWFKKNGVWIEGEGLKSRVENDLSRAAAIRRPLRPLSPSLLGHIVDPSYIEDINTRACRRPWQLRAGGRLSGIRLRVQRNWRLTRLAEILGLKVEERFTKAYSEYMTLWPLEMLASGCDRSTPSSCGRSVHA